MPRCGRTDDADLLLGAAGALNDGRPVIWPAFLDAWLAIAHGVAQAGMPTVLLGPIIPDRLRRNIPDRVDTSSGTPEDTAAAIATWIDRHLPGTGPQPANEPRLEY